MIPSPLEILLALAFTLLTHWSVKALETRTRINRTPGFSTTALAAPETLQQVVEMKGTESVDPAQLAHETEWAESPR